MKVDFNIVDESIGDTLATEQQIAAEINYDEGKKPITSFYWILCSIKSGNNNT